VLAKCVLMDKLRAADLWEQSCGFRDQQRQALRNAGLSRKAAVQESWYRTADVFEYFNDCPEPFEPTRLTSVIELQGDNDPAVFAEIFTWSFLNARSNLTGTSPPHPDSSYCSFFTDNRRELYDWGAEFFDESVAHACPKCGAAIA
jgi:hypothetical protein